MQALRSKLTYANVISTLALFLVLGGSAAFAAGQLGPNSVGTTQLRNAAVTGPKIKRASIEATKLTPLAISTLKGQKGAKGATGAKGAPGAKGGVGAKGDRGAQGERGLTGPQGIQGVAGNPGAYATILTEDPLRFEGTHPGFTAVARPDSEAAGVYCLTPASGVDIAHPVASLDASNSDGSGLLVEPLAGGVVACDPGQLEVRTYTLEEVPPALTDNASFTVFVPGN
jgi:hypothetical protein